jgi:hypothetical protein
MLLQAAQPGYSLATLLALTSATRSHLKYWIREGVIVADFAEAEGTGVHRRFSTLNVIETQLCAALSAYHVSIDVLRGAVRILRRFHVGAVAMYESGVIKAPFEPTPWRASLFKDPAARKSAGMGFLIGQGWSHGRPDAAQAYERAVAVVTRWAALRTSPVLRGEYDDSAAGFIRLVVGDAFGVVIVDPAALAEFTEQTAVILVDLVGVASAVGQRARKLGIVLEPW